MEFNQYLSLYCEAKSSGTKLDDEVKQYIDDAIQELRDTGEEAKYNVLPSYAEGRLSVIDIDKGSLVGTISPKGKLISVPVVYHDRVSFAVQDDQGRVTGTVHSLPNGEVINQFRVGEPKKGMKFKEVMGKEDDPGIEPEEEPDEKGSENGIDKDIEDIVDTELDTTDLDTHADELEQIKAEIDDVERNRVDKTAADYKAEISSLYDKLETAERLKATDSRAQAAKGAGELARARHAAAASKVPDFDDDSSGSSRFGADKKL